MGAAVVSMLLLSALAACGKSGDTARTVPPASGAAPPQAPPPQAPSPQAAAPSPPPPAQPAAVAPPPPPAPAAAPAPSGPLATSDGEFPGTSVAIQSLTRGPNALTLRFVFSNNSKSGFNLATYFAENGAPYRSISGVNLLDAANKQKYFPQKDADGTPLCSRDIPDVAPQTQVTLWVKFPAPPPGVRAMTVVIPHFVPMEDVPISP
jgi:hypothetical protein